MPKRQWIFLTLTVLAGGLLSCAPAKFYLSNHFATAGRLAVLPMSNETTDLDGPIFVRQIIFNELAMRGFQLIPLADIDAKLKTQGFTDGGQLRAATPQQLGEWIGADTLFYSTLENFNYINIGYYWQRKVKVLGRLVDAKTGERLWEAERSSSTLGVAPNTKEAERQFTDQLAIKAIEKMAHSPLQLESHVAIDQLLATLPHH